VREEVDDAATVQKGRGGGVVGGGLELLGVVCGGNNDLARVEAGTVGRVVVDGREEVLNRGSSVVDGNKANVIAVEADAEEGATCVASEACHMM
jgi:hypothetical protein